MRNGVRVLWLLGAFLALQAPFPIASLATDGVEPRQPAKQAGENRWVPSLAIIGGATIQNQDGFANSFLFEGANPTPVPLRGVVDGNDLAVSPFVGGSLELMTPALPIPTRPRLFLSAGILPTFASDRDVALEGDPDCVRGPEPDSPCVNDEGTSRIRPFGETSINGLGTSTTAQVDTLVFDASFGVALPLQFGKRQLRIKPSVGWINYKVDAEGLVVNGECDPVTQCSNVYDLNGMLLSSGFVRQTMLEASDSQVFNGIGPGLDIELDVGRYGPLGVSLFLGGRAYRVLGNRTIAFSASESYDDVLGMDRAVGDFEVEVDPWMYRANLGIRILWLGSPE